VLAVQAILLAHHQKYHGSKEGPQLPAQQQMAQQKKHPEK